MGVENLFGVWRLLTLQFVVSDTGEAKDMYGPDPLGYIFLTPDQRMMTIITANDRTNQDGDFGKEALFDSMMAYTGSFRIEGENQFVTDVEVSWHPEWQGSEQTRLFSLEDDILSIMTTELLHPMFPGRKGRGVLKWQRMSQI